MPVDRQLEKILVVGTGVAGMRAAETLRLDGYRGELTVVGAERHAPYQRPPLSKKLLSGAVHRAGADLAPRMDLEARVLRGASVRELDMSTRTAHLRDGSDDVSVPFDGLVVATGAAARQWPDGPVPDGVMALRTVDDCLAIRERLESRPRVVVVGGGFIGAEVAATCRSMGLSVTLIEKSSAPMASALGDEMAACWERLHRGNGVELRSGVGVESFAGDDRVEAVHLTDGTRLPADLVIIGLGVTPSVDWLSGSDLRLDNGVVCDATGAVEGVTDVVAAGDVASWWHPRYERYLRIEHWEHAERQGVAAAHTLLAGPERAQEFDALPYFWTDQYDVKMQMLGVPDGYDSVAVVEGSPDRWDFVAAYGRDGRVIAVLSTIPGRVHAYRDAVFGAFPPAPPG